LAPIIGAFYISDYLENPKTITRKGIKYKNTLPQKGYN
jgi:hypothetical protein